MARAPWAAHRAVVLAAAKEALQAVEAPQAAEALQVAEAQQVV